IRDFHVTGVQTCALPILKCKNADDVAQGVKFARENNLEVSIKSGGHNGAGLALVNDGLVIDLSEMNDIQIDLEKQTAKIQPGSRSEERRVGTERRSRSKQ